MIRTYRFFGEEPFEFEDSGTVKELIAYAFDRFGYYEPFGFDTVTVFQCYHSKSDCGWFTTDTSKTCADEIENSDWLCFAYHIPGLLYYAEGGWGHHMPELGNHPVFNQPVSLELRFEDFKHTVVFEGTRSFSEVLGLLKQTGYIYPDVSRIKVDVLAHPSYTKYIDCNSPIVSAPMSEFEKAVPSEGHVILSLVSRMVGFS